MGIFDIFTGDSAKQAAAANSKEYKAYETNSLGDLDSSLTNQKAAVQGATDAWQPVSALGEKYGAGSNLYMDSLGINGADGNARATSAFQAGPGFTTTVDNATDAAMRKANALGGLGGNEIAQVGTIGANLANNQWNDWQTKLGGFVPQEASNTQAAAGGVAAGKGAEAGMYATDAQNRINVRGNKAGGIANSNTASANAQMAGSGTFWNGLITAAGAAAKGGK